MNKIALITPKSAGGVKHITDKLQKGLEKEGFSVKCLTLHGENLIKMVWNDVQNVRIIHNFPVVIYMGSIPHPSHLFIKGRTTVILFVHGFVMDEIISYIKDLSTSVRAKIFATYPALLWSFSKIMKSIDFYICHSITSCEANGIRERFVLLPQFILPEEVEFCSKLEKEISKQDGERIKVITYGSFAISPRLLTQYQILMFMRKVSRSVNREIELVMIDPKTKEGEERWKNLLIRRFKYLPRKDFLKLLAESDLYIERCIDEELRMASIEAALLGTPIAKLTHPKFVERQDYMDEVIWSRSVKELIDMLSDYLNNAEHWKPFYSKKLRSFVINKRSWDHVKGSLLDLIRHEY